MKLIEVKKNTDVNLAGITAEVDFTNGSVTCVTLVDSTGRKVKIEHGPYGGMRVLVPEPPKKIKQYRVTATFPESMGLGTVKRDFSDKYSAEALVAAFNNEVRSVLESTIEEVEVFEEA